MSTYFSPSRTARCLLLATLLLSFPLILRANIPGGGNGTGANVTLAVNSGQTSGTMSNGIAQIIFTTSGAVINQINYTYNNGSGTVTKKILNGGKDGGQLYWEFGGYGGSTWTYTDAVDPSTTGGNYAEIALTSLASGTGAEGDLQVNFSMLRGSPGFYVTLTMTHHNGDIATGLGEMRTNIYISPDFNWMSESPFVQREVPLNGPSPPSAITSFDAPQECSLWTAGVDQGTYEDKYKFSELFGTERVWGWGSISDAAHGITTGANVGIWNILASSEYFNGGPMKPELMDAPMVNMLNGGHYEMGSDSNWSANEQWTRVQGPYFVYLNNVSNTITDPVQASQALYNDAVAQGVAEATAWPYSWFNNTQYGNNVIDANYATAAQRGTVTGQIVINDPGNPNASGSNMWVGVVQQPATADNVYDFQLWYKPYQFWVKADANGNFTIPAVISGTGYTLYAFGAGAEGTFMSQNQNGGNPPLLYNLPAIPFSVTVVGGATTNLGPVIWTPTRVGPTVFEIGYPDRTGHKFRHGDDWWVGDIGPSPTEPSPIWTKFLELPNDFPSGVNYTVGVNQWPTDWFFIQPVLISPSNVNTNSSSTINFALPSTPSGTASLYLGIASDYSASCAITVNNTNLGSTGGVTATPNGISTAGFTPSYHISDTSVREGCNAAFSDERINFPASLLHSGSNTIKIAMNQIGSPYGADHFIYDYIRLELTGYVPPPPASAAAYPGNGSVLLTWPVTPGATSYNVLRSNTSGAGYSAIASGTTAVIGPSCGSGPSNATYVDTTASNDATYYYVVQSVNTTGTSANSTQSAPVVPSLAISNTPPAAPTGLTVSATTGVVSLSWDASSGANYYTIQRTTVINKIPNFSPSPTLSSTSTFLSTITLSNSVTGLSYVDSSVTNGSEYGYTVLAGNAAGTSGTSAMAIAKPLPAAVPGPAAPTVTAAASSGQVTLNWSAVPGAVGYVIEVANNPNGPYSLFASVGDLTYTETGLVANSTYYYTIIPVNATGVGTVSAQVSTGPAPPASLAATPGDTQVTLSWPAASGATSYAVQRGIATGGPYSFIGTSAGLTYTDTGLTNGTSYYYVVDSVSSTGTGENSPEATATPSASLPIAPRNLTAAPGTGQVVLSWSASAGATGYNILRSTSNGGPYSVAIPGVTTTSSTDTNVLGGLTYYYVVTASNASGMSAYSNQATATVPGTSNLIWTGSASTAWDYTTVNWATQGGAATTYADGVNAVFPDGASTGTVEIAGTVNPSSVNFTNATLAYTLNSAAAGVSGSAGVIKSGAGTVTLTGSQSYTGGATIEGGIYALGADSSTSATTIESPGLSGGTCASLGPAASAVLVNNGGELRFGGHGGALETYIIPNAITVDGATVFSVDGLQELTGGLAINPGGATLITEWSSKNLWVHSTWSGSGNVTINDYKASGSDTSAGAVLVDTASNPYNGTITIQPPSNGYLGGILEIGNNTALINATIIDNNTGASGVAFSITAPQVGALGGSGNIAIPSGSIVTGGNGSSTTYSGILSGVGGLTKAGAGTMILSGDNTYTGATTVTGGILEITGAIASSTSASVSNGAVLYIDGGTLSIEGAITNNGLVKLAGSASVTSSGAFTNNGVLDLINGPQSLPANFTNNGTVLNSSAVQVQQFSPSGSNNFSLTIQGYAQHTYQLQRAASLTPPVTWTNVGAAQAGTGAPLNFSDTSAPNPQGFYQIQVSP